MFASCKLIYKIRYKIRHHPTDENYFWGSKLYLDKNTAPYGCSDKVFTDFKRDFEEEYPDTTLPAEMTSLFRRRVDSTKRMKPKERQLVAPKASPVVTRRKQRNAAFDLHRDLRPSGLR